MVAPSARDDYLIKLLLIGDIGKIKILLKTHLSFVQGLKLMTGFISACSTPDPSGFCVRLTTSMNQPILYHVGPTGWTKLSGDDVGELHYSYYPIEPAVVEQEMAEA